MRPVGKMGIPSVRDELVLIAWALESGQLIPADAAVRIRALIPHMIRNRPEHTRSKGKECPEVTPEIKEAILSLHKLGWSSWRISITLGINSGRVSEVLHGLR
jgi:hypothetical protein